MSESKIKLSEKLVEIVNKLPWNFPPSPNLPDLLVEPSGFRRIIGSGMETCKKFTNTLYKIQSEVEESIPGITSFYLLTSEGKKKSGIICTMSGSMVSTTASLNLCNYSPGLGIDKPERGEVNIEGIEKSIFEKVGNIMLYKGRKLDQSEIISFYTGIIALEKTTNLKVDVADCLSALGSMQLALDVGKLYSKTYDIIYWHEQTIKAEPKPSDLLPISNMWSIFSKVSTMNTILDSLI